MVSKFIVAGILALSLIAILPVASNAAVPESDAPVRGTTASYVIASAHNYANSYTYTWPTKTVTGATQIRVHFTKIDMESNYDFVYVLNSAGTQYSKFTGLYSSGVWSAWVPGTSLKVKMTTDSSVVKWGFATDLIEYDTGTGGGVITLTNGVATSGSLSAAGASQMYQITVNSGATNMKTTVSDPTSSDFDSYGKLGAQPTTSSYTWRGYTGNHPEVVDYANPGAGTWYIMVYAYSGSGSFTITCAITYGSSDTTAPVVTISAPASGATVSGTTTISFSATDANGISSYKIKIDGTQVATTNSYSWATTSYANGAHTIRCEATDPSSNVGYSERSVTVSNTVVDDGGALTDGVTANGNMDSADVSDMWYIDVGASATSMYVVLGIAGSGDFDDYGKFNAQPTTSVYDWRGYTSGGEENTVTNPAQGRHYIMVQYYSGSGAYTLTVTITYGTPPGPGNFKLGQLTNKYALVVGISDYKAINDLSYCDEDATDWYNYLVNTCGYPAANVRVLGDGASTSSYPVTCWGKATEANYKTCLTWLAGQTGAEISFITSGHGSGDGAGESYLCAWDCSSGESGQDGNFYDHEISAILGAATAAKIFVFIDHCYSGGIGPELMAMSNKANVYCTTTCTANGYGYDEPSSSNGAWTNQFVHVTLQAHFGSSINTTMEEAFTYAASGYSHTGGDAPMQFDGSP
jgi:hypothetical protein